jgi:uncharacterized membrane protein YeiH
VDVLTAAANGVAQLQLPLAVNVIAVAVGAVVGTLMAGQYDDMDVVGMFVLAVCFGFGGSILRDILLGHLPPVTFRTPVYLVTVLVAVLIASFFLAYLAHLEKPLWVVDSLSIGLFAAVGTNAALLTGLGFLPAVIVGTIQAVGGGVLVDGLLGRPSSLMFRGPMNVVAGSAGALAYALLFDLTNATVATTAAVVSTFGLRLAGRVKNLQTPLPIKEPLGLRGKVLDPLAKPPRSLRRRLRAMWTQLGAFRDDEPWAWLDEDD